MNRLNKLNCDFTEIKDVHRQTSASGLNEEVRISSDVATQCDAV